MAWTSSRRTSSGSAISGAKPPSSPSPVDRSDVSPLTATAEEAAAAAREGDSATLRRVLQSFEVLTAAIWTVQDAVRPTAEIGPLAAGQQEDNGDPEPADGSWCPPDPPASTRINDAALL